MGRSIGHTKSLGHHRAIMSVCERGREHASPVNTSVDRTRYCRAGADATTNDRAQEAA